MAGAKNEVTLTFAGDSASQTVGLSTTAAWGQAKTFALSVDGTPLTSQSSTGTTLWYTWDTTKVGNGSRALGDHGNSLGKLGDKADGAESKLIGVHDVIDGTAAIMQGPGKAGMAAYVQGWADLAGGMAPLLIGLAQTKVGMMAHVLWSGIVKGATATWAGVQWLLNAALTANPIGLIIVGTQFPGQSEYLASAITFSLVDFVVMIVVAVTIRPNLPWRRASA